MIISDQCDVKNVFEPDDWLKDPFDVTFDLDLIHTWLLSLLSVFNWANSKTAISGFSLYSHFREQFSLNRFLSRISEIRTSENLRPKYSLNVIFWFNDTLSLILYSPRPFLITWSWGMKIKGTAGEIVFENSTLNLIVKKHCTLFLSFWIFLFCN